MNLIRTGVRIIFLASFIFLAVCSLKAQQSSFNLPDYHPVSPNAASLGSFGLYPVNKNLGTSAISVPIYSLSEGDLTVPIDLNYISSGIRLNDLASWVGLGWSLNAGGAIIRNVKGRPDIAYNSTVPNLQNAAFTQSNYDYMQGATNGLRDTAPDQYVLNALGRSASFYFDQDDNFKAKFEDGSPIKVTVVSADELHAILEDGTLLIFGKDNDNNTATEVTDYNNKNYIFDYISAWYLTELVSNDRQQRISFKYKSQAFVDGYSDPVGESIYIDNSFSVVNANSYLKASYHELTKVSRKYLEKIVFDNGHIYLESSQGRGDLLDDYKLNAIKVYTDNGSSNGKLVDQYHFTYGEFIRSGGVFSLDYTVAPVFFGSDRQVRSRERAMKLLTIYRGATPNDGQVHRFDYNGTALPIRCTTSQDSWGFANNNVGSLLPQTVASVTGLASVNYTVGNGNRSSNEAKMKAAVLEKITYPTGGHTIFEHEANRFLGTDMVYVPRFEIARAFGSECTDQSEPHYVEKTFNVPAGSKNIRLILDMSPVGSQGGNISYVSLGDRTYYRPTPNSNGGPSDSSDGRTETININFGQNISSDPFNQIVFQPGAHTIKAFDSGYGGAIGARNCSTMQISIAWDEPSGTQQVEKLVGGLRIKSISNYDGNSATPTNVRKFDYTDPDLIHPEENRGYTRRIFTFNGSDAGVAAPIILSGGGSNAEKILLCSLVSTSPHFNNNLGGEPVISYGTVTEYDFNAVNNENKGKTVSYYEPVPRQRILSSLLGATSFRHPNYSSSYFFGKALSSGGSWNLQSQQLLSNAIDGLGSFSYYETTSWKRGKLAKEETFKTEGGIDILIDLIEHTYTTIESLKVYHNYVYSPFDSPPLSAFWNVADNPYDQDADFSSIVYSYQIGEIELGRRVRTKTVNTRYDDTGQNPLTTTTNYHYDNLDHKQLTRTEVKNSKGEDIITQTFYADDIDNVGSLGAPDLSLWEKNAIDRLKQDDLHRIAEPVQTVTTVKIGATVLSRTTQRTNYNDWGSNLVLPDSLQTLKGDYSTMNKMQNRILFLSYNSNGNPLELSKVDGPVISYIWGYNKMYPIAKIENANYTQVATALGISEKALKTYDETDLGAIDGLRSSLPSAMVSTYIYDPLIGVKTITDPRGYTISYQYDTFNRLKAVKDQAGNLITDFDYHYKDQ